DDEGVHAVEAGTGVTGGEQDEEVLVVPDGGVRVDVVGDVRAAARYPAVRVDPGSVGDRVGPQRRHGVEVNSEAVVGQVLHVEERIERLAVMRARRAVGPGGVAVVDVPHAVVAGGAAGGVRPVVNAVVIQVAVVRVSAVLVVRGQLPCGGTGGRVVRVPEVGVLVVDARVSDGDRLVRPEDAVVVDRGRVVHGVPALDDPARQVVHHVRLDEAVDVHDARDAGEFLDHALRELRSHAAGLTEGIARLVAAEEGDGPDDLGNARGLEGHDLDGDRCARRLRAGGGRGSAAEGGADGADRLSCGGDGGRRAVQSEGLRRHARTDHGHGIGGSLLAVPRAVHRP